jgi:hypothetical protein
MNRDFPDSTSSWPKTVAVSAVEGNSGFDWDIAWRSPGFVEPIWRLNGGCTVRLVLGERTSTCTANTCPARVLFVCVAYFAAFAFWTLDGYFLLQKRLLRALFEYVRTSDGENIDFSMDTSRFAIDPPCDK